MENENSNFFSKAPWLLGGVVIIAVFVLCFLAIDYVSKPSDPVEPEIEEVVIATEKSNDALIDLARQEGWIAEDATEMTSLDAAAVTSFGTALQGCSLQHFDEFRYFLGIKELLPSTFSGCEALQSVTIPPSVISINYGAFTDCPSLTQLRVDTANTHYDSRKDCNGIVCTWKGKLMLVVGCRATRVIDGIRFIAPQAFRGCTTLTEIDLPEKMDEIGEEAFSGCTALTTFTVPQGVRFIEKCTFQGCTSLHTVTLSKSVERLREKAFNGCTALNRIVCPKKYPPIVEDAFDNYSATVVVPKGLQNNYYTSKYWKDFPHVVEGD